MLARALDLPGVAMGLSEPVILNDVVGFRRRGAAPRDVARLADAATAAARPSVRRGRGGGGQAFDRGQSARPAAAGAAPRCAVRRALRPARDLPAVGGAQGAGMPAVGARAVRGLSARRVRRFRLFARSDAVPPERPPDRRARLAGPAPPVRRADRRVRRAGRDARCGPAGRRSGGGAGCGGQALRTGARCRRNRLRARPSPAIRSRARPMESRRAAPTMRRARGLWRGDRQGHGLGASRGGHCRDRARSAQRAAAAQLSRRSRTARSMAPRSGSTGAMWRANGRHWPVPS